MKSAISDFAAPKQKKKKEKYVSFVWIYNSLGVSDNNNLNKTSFGLYLFILWLF